MQISNKGKQDWKLTAKVQRKMMGRNGAQERNSKVEKNIGEEIEEKKSGYSKSSSRCWHTASPGLRGSSLLSAHWPPPHLNAHSALIKYSFSKTSTYITNTTSVSPCWPDWTEQCVTTKRGANNYPRSKLSVSSAGTLRIDDILAPELTSSASKVHCCS